jgi:hypothetical protein
MGWLHIAHQLLPVWGTSITNGAPTGTLLTPGSVVRGGAAAGTGAAPGRRKDDAVTGLPSLRIGPFLCQRLDERSP